MLTVRQLLVTSGQNAGDLHTSGLPRQHTGDALSLRSTIALYEQQRRTYFVRLTSPNILLSSDVQSFEDLVTLSTDIHGEMSREEVEALAANLESHGVLVRLVARDFRHAALIGTVTALANVPTTRVNEQNFTQVRDKVSGIIGVGGGLGAFGGVIVTIATIPEPASPVLFVIGLGLISAGAGAAIVGGIIDMTRDSPPAPTKDSSDKTKSELDSPDGQTDDGQQDSLEIPNAVAIGEPPPGFDVDGLVANLADSALDYLLSDIPIGWDGDTGTGIPLGGGDLGDPGGGDGGGGIGIPGVPG